MITIRDRTRRRSLAAMAIVAGLGAALMPAVPTIAQDDAAQPEATYRDVEATLGGVPTFVLQFPPAGIAGAWAELKAIEFGDTALDAKTKALIGIAVAAQIPCHYCVWADTNAAKAAGASEEEIAEAVAMSAITRHWSTVFHGMQVDFEQFKVELGGDVDVQ